MEFLSGSHAVKVTSSGESNKRILCKVLEIGDWNMDSTGSKTVAHNIDSTKILSVTAVVRNDSGDTSLFNGSLFNAVNPPPLANQWETWFPVTTVGWNSTNIILQRMYGSGFDGTSYDSTSYNRGWVTIFYEE